MDVTGRSLSKESSSENKLKKELKTILVMKMSMTMSNGRKLKERDHQWKYTKVTRAVTSAARGSRNGYLVVNIRPGFPSRLLLGMTMTE